MTESHAHEILAYFKDESKSVVIIADEVTLNSTGLKEHLKSGNCRLTIFGASIVKTDISINFRHALKYLI